MANMVLLTMINDSRGNGIADRNFRTSCHTMKENGLLTEYRGKGHTLHWTLTEAGLDKAMPIFKERMAEAEQ
ncbi:putative oRF7 [Alteromonas macleodii]|nr:putative oRF7 [Alteromonas macleodii]